MNKGMKRLITVLIIFAIIAAIVFLFVYLLAKQKKIFINTHVYERYSEMITFFCII